MGYVLTGALILCNRYRANFPRNVGKCEFSRRKLGRIFPRATSLLLLRSKFLDHFSRDQDVLWAKFKEFLSELSGQSQLAHATSGAAKDIGGLAGCAEVG